MRLLAALSLACCLLAASAQLPPAGAGQPPAAPAAAPAQPAQPATLLSQSVSLPPFVEVDLCAPFSILITPNTSGGYALTLAAEPSAAQAISYNVVNNALRIETTADFNTTRPIQLTVSLPADQLQAVAHAGTGAEVFVAPGFNVPAFTATATYGAGRLFVSGMTAKSVTYVLSSTGDIVLGGSFGTVNATTTGTGSLYISGVTDQVELDMRGVSDAYVIPASGAAKITGTAAGLNTVQFTNGTCSVTSAISPIFSICQQVPFLVFPVASPQWTCGLSVAGPWQCSKEGLAFSSVRGVDSTSGDILSFPSSTVGERSAFTPSSYVYTGPSPTGPGTGTQQQAGSVTPGGTTAQSAVQGTGSVSAVSVAGPGGAQTSTTQGGLTTGFQTTGQQTTGTLPGGPAAASSTAFSTATSTTAASATAGSSAATTPSVGGVARVFSPSSRATALSAACEAYPAELIMPSQGARAPSAEAGATAGAGAGAGPVASGAGSGQ